MNRREAFEMGRGLMNENGLGNWSFQFDSAKRRFGRCSYANKTISLSEPMTLINDREKVRETILHEIAHALAGFDAGHGPAWARECRKLGIRPARCYSDRDTETVPAAWVGRCPSCGKELKRHRLTDKSKRIACGSCCKRYNGGRFDSRFKFVWRRNTGELFQSVSRNPEKSLDTPTKPWHNTGASGLDRFRPN